MSEKLQVPDSFEDAERFQRLFVQPMVDAVKTEMSGHVADVKQFMQETQATVNTFEGRIKRLEGEQKKALLGWGVYATLIGVGFTAAWKYVQSKIHFG